MPVPALPVRFQSTLPCRSDRHQDYSATLYMDFNPRSLAGATGNITGNIGAGIISIHAPLRERRYGMVYTSKIRSFQSTLPCGSDTIEIISYNSREISIHAPLRERRASALASQYNLGISIHAPLRERPVTFSDCYLVGFISIHAPLRERQQLNELPNYDLKISIHAPLRERL